MLVQVRYSSNSKIGIFINNGSGSFLPKVEYSAGVTPLRIKVIDLDNDGYLDLIVSSSAILLCKVNIYFGKNDGTYNLPLALAISSQANVILAKDIDADGATDLVIPDNNAKTDVYLNKN